MARETTSQQEGVSLIAAYGVRRQCRHRSLNPLPQSPRRRAGDDNGWSLACGFQSESYRITVSAVCRLMPRPPALVDSMNTNLVEFGCGTVVYKPRREAPHRSLVIQLLQATRCDTCPTHGRA